MTASSVRAKPSRKSISLHVLRARLIRIRPDSSTRVSTETHAARSTSTKEKKLTSPPSRRSFAKRSPSTVLASRNLRRKRSPKGSRLEVSLPTGSAHPPADRVVAHARTPSATGIAPYLLEAWQWLGSGDGPWSGPEVQLEEVLLASDSPKAPRCERARVLVVDDNADMRVRVRGRCCERAGRGGSSRQCGRSPSRRPA